MLDADKFRGVIAEKGLNQRKLAQMLGISETTMYTKVRKGVFGSDEILQIASILGLDNNRIIEIFLPLMTLLKCHNALIKYSA